MAPPARSPFLPQHGFRLAPITSKASSPAGTEDDWRPAHGLSFPCAPPQAKETSGNQTKGTGCKWYRKGSTAILDLGTLEDGTLWVLIWSADQSLCAGATGCSSCRSGRSEKNLCQQGSQRSAGSPKIRPSVPVTPCIRSGEMLCNAKLPQISQCAYRMARNGIEGA